MTGYVLPQVYDVVPIDSLTPHPQNANEGDIGAIHESIDVCGFYGAVIVQKSTRFILVGNHRWKAARASGITEIPCFVVDVDERGALKIMTGDNRTAALATINEDELAHTLTILASGPDGLRGTGYDAQDLDDLIRNVGGSGDPPGGEGGGSPCACCGK